MKVGKEEIIGCLTALETWLKIDEKKIYASGKAESNGFESWWRLCPACGPTFTFPRMAIAIQR